MMVKNENIHRPTDTLGDIEASRKVAVSFWPGCLDIILAAEKMGARGMEEKYSGSHFQEQV